MASFSGSAADMLKKYGQAVPETEKMSSLEESQAAKAKLEAGKVCTDEHCTEDHTHGHSHGHGETCTEDHGHGGHDHKKADHAHEKSAHEHGHEHSEGCCDGAHGHDKSEHARDKAEGHGGGHGHSAEAHGHAAPETHGAEQSHGQSATPAFEGCAKGKYDWAGTAGGKVAAKDGAVGSRITDYAFGDGPKKASVYVDLEGLDDVADADMAATLVAPTKLEFSVTIGGAARKLTLTPLLEPCSAAKILRKPGKNRVVLKLTKEEAKPWAKLLAQAATGFEDDAPAGGAGGVGDMASMMGGLGGMGGGDMAGMAEMMAKMRADKAADPPGGPPEVEDDLDDLPDLEEDNVD